MIESVERAQNRYMRALDGYLRNAVAEQEVRERDKTFRKRLRSVDEEIQRMLARVGPMSEHSRAEVQRLLGSRELLDREERILKRYGMARSDLDRAVHRFRLGDGRQEFDLADCIRLVKASRDDFIQRIAEIRLNNRAMSRSMKKRAKADAWTRLSEVLVVAALMCGDCREPELEALSTHLALASMAA